MRKISKGLAIAVTVIAIGGASLAAVAQTGGPGPGYGPPGSGSPGYGPMGHGGMGSMQGWGSYGMMGAWGGGGFADPATQLDALKTELAIRPEQTAAWDAYAKAMRDAATQMQAVRGSIDFDKLRTMSWQDHQTYMGQFHDRQAAAFQSVQAARATLLAALDDTQKSRLPPASGNFGPGMMGWYGGSPMMGRGYGMMSWGRGDVR
ncbi:MAG: hypothetical protein P4L90_21390 [Rhodopila sp.]|nr:hypothetical protein [Rhodopila sp.]